MEIPRLIDLTRRWAILIVAASVTAAVAAFLVSASLPKQYTSEARVLVGTLTASTYDQQLAYQQLAQTYAEVATTTPVLSRVSDQLGLGDPTNLATRLDVRAPLGQSIVRISATGRSGGDAMQLANAVAEQITTLSRPAAGGSGVASVIQPALVPEAPSAPLLLLNTLVAAALGLALGFGLALLLATQVQSLHVSMPAAFRAARRPPTRAPETDVLPATGDRPFATATASPLPSFAVPPVAAPRPPAAAPTPTPSLRSPVDAAARLPAPAPTATLPAPELLAAVAPPRNAARLQAVAAPPRGDAGLPAGGATGGAADASASSSVAPASPTSKRGAATTRSPSAKSRPAEPGSQVVPRTPSKTTPTPVTTGRRRGRTTIGLDPLELLPAVGEPRRTTDALVHTLEAVQTRRPA